MLFNYAIREITAKVVYYGPGLGGKTTNLQFIHRQLDPAARGKLLSLATDGDRTLFFDFLPIEMGNIGGYKVRFQLYTVPGQVHYNATRKLVLKGVDAVAFVADSQITMLERNRESFENLVQNLTENGYEPAKIPIVIQLNKRDLPNVASPADLVASMGVAGFPLHEAVANRGDGVFETLKTVIRLTLSRLRTQFDADSAPGEQKEAGAPPPPPVAVFTAVRREAAPAEVPAAPAPAAPAVATAPVAGQGAEGEFEEIDLEELTEEPGPAAEPPAPAPPGPPGREEVLPETPAAAEPSVEEGIVDLEAHHELSAEEGLLETEEAGLDLDESRRGFFEEQFQREEPAAGPEPACAAEAPAPPPAPESPGPPPWAEEILAEIARLRGENRALRAALAGFAGVMERQIALLQEGSERLAQGAASAGEEGEERR